MNLEGFNELPLIKVAKLLIKLPGKVKIKFQKVDIF